MITKMYFELPQIHAPMAILIISYKDNKRILIRFLIFLLSSIKQANNRYVSIDLYVVSIRTRDKGESFFVRFELLRKV